MAFCPQEISAILTGIFDGFVLFFGRFCFRRLLDLLGFSDTTSGGAPSANACSAADHFVS